MAGMYWSNTTHNWQFQTGEDQFGATTTLSGTTAGSAQWVELTVGSHKKIVVALSGYENTTATAQTITFPAAFTAQAAVTSQPSGFGATVSTTTLTLPVSMAAVVNGVIVVEGI